MFALFPAAMFVPLGGAQIWRSHCEPYKFLLHILKNNSAVENCTDVRLGQVVNLTIFIISEILGFRVLFLKKITVSSHFFFANLQNADWQIINSSSQKRKTTADLRWEKI